MRGLGFAVAIGLAGIAIWLAPVWCFEKFGLGGDESPLRWLGFRERRDGFDPTLLGHGPNPVGSWLVLGLRFLRLVVVVPLVEEIFWRGFLMRWLIESAKRWDELDVGAFAWKSFGLTTAFFALAHAGPDVAVALVYGALAGWVTVRTRGLTAVIVMHAVANFALGIFVMKTGWWGLW